MSKSETPLLCVRDLTVGFPNDTGEVTPILKNVSFDLHQSEVVALVGESGSGKSLTALSILNLLSGIGAVHQGGEVLYGNEDLLRLPEERLRPLRGKEISMVFQDPFASFNPLLTVGSHLDAVLRYHADLPRQKRTERISSLLTEVALADPSLILRKYPHELSGGMLQRVMIAMALLHEPKLLIADEITTALDTMTQRIILELLRKLQKQHHLSLLFITHDLALAANAASRVLVMQDGEMVEDTSVREIFIQPKHPYTKMLLRSLPTSLFA